MSTAFNEHQFEKRLQLLKDSQESIQSLSTWCLQQRQNHKKIVACWLRVLKKVKIEHRLTLFYLANDVIQYSKRKNYEFVESWATALQRATPMVREDKVKHRILRIFKIWDERGIYDEAFIADLQGLLSTTTKKTNSEAVVDTSDFQPPTLIAKIRSCKNLEDDTDLKLKRLNESHMCFTDADALRSHLKDRRQGDDLVAEVDEGLLKMQGFVKALELEIKERTALIDLLEQADSFYETQKGEAKVVANAYRNFGSRVKNLKRHLDELMPTLKDVSPIPSPDINAPSPSPDSDIDLPGENDNTGSIGDSFFNSYSSAVNPIKTVLHDDSNQQHSMDNCFSSFMGNSTLAFDIQGRTSYSMVQGYRGNMKSLFSETSIDTPASPPPMNMEEPSVPLLNEPVSEGKPIEVINSRSKSEESFNITEFIKSLIPSRGSPIIPGLMDPPPQDEVSKSLYNTNNDLNSSAPYDYPEPPPPPTPLQPPPMPPSLFPLEDTSYKYEQPLEREEDAWNTKLPPKFPTWGDTSTGWEREESEKTSEWTPVLPPNKVIPALSLDTPESPPMYEKEGFSDPVEYDDSIVEPPLMSSSGDVDHRTLVHLPQINHSKDSDCRIPPPLKHMKDTDQRVIPPVTPTNHAKKDMDHRSMLSRKKDIDHRNLISLTGSPVREHTVLPPPPTPPILNWSHSDQDYRTTIAPPPLPPSKKEIMHQADQDYRLHPPHLGRRHHDETQDNVESVDMEMSDEEMADGMEDMLHDKKCIIDKDRDYDSGNKPMISFNINSNTKVLVNSPLNEAKEDASRPRGQVYGCQKIPTISGIGGNTHSPRGMGPLRPRMQVLTPPPNIKRIPPPGLPRGFRPSMMTPPPPLPPFPPHLLAPPERFNVTIEIKPQEEIESQIKTEKQARNEDFVKKEVLTDMQPPPPFPPALTPILPATIPVEKMKQEINENKDWKKEPILPKSIPEIEIKREQDIKSEKSEQVVANENQDVGEEMDEQQGEEGGGEEEIGGEEGDGGGGEGEGGGGGEEEEKIVNENEQVEMVPNTEPMIRSDIQNIIKPMEITGSEHWMNNELAELEQIGNKARDQGSQGDQFFSGPGSQIGPGGQFGPGGLLGPGGLIGSGGQIGPGGPGGRGRPFKNFRGGFMPRVRPMWNGPRRGGPRHPPPPQPPPQSPQGRFPFRPPLERPFGRGHRGGGGGGFRPFRGNRGHRGGW